jgi:hypothetical protein
MGQQISDGEAEFSNSKCKYVAIFQFHTSDDITNNLYSNLYTSRRISFVIPVPWRSSVVSRQHFLNNVDGKEFRPLFLRSNVC